MRKAILYFGLVGLLFMTGCASLINGGMQQIAVNSEPSGAKARLGRQTQTTPALFTVNRKDPAIRVEVSKEGYETSKFQMSKGLNLWTLGNVIWGLFGGIIGVAVDAGTGAISKHEPSEVNVNLVKE